MSKIKNGGKLARVFEFENNILTSSEFQIMNLQKNTVSLIKDEVSYTMTSEFNIPDYCIDGEVFVIFMVLSKGMLYPIQFPGKSESDVIFKIPITDPLKAKFFESQKFASFSQELEQLKDGILKNIKEIETNVPFVQCTNEVKKRSTYVIENKNKRNKRRRKTN